MGTLAKSYQKGFPDALEQVHSPLIMYGAAISSTVTLGSFGNT